jgi:hypothetical protein
VDPINQSFVVQGVTFYTTASTGYDDGLKSFADLPNVQKVEIELEYQDNKHYATESNLRIDLNYSSRIVEGEWD